MDSGAHYGNGHRGAPMRDEAKRYEGSTFAMEKVLTTLHVVMFVAIVGIGVYHQANPSAKPVAIAAAR
jgi:hypothetical protein